MAAFITPTELKSYPLPVTAAQWSKVGDDQLAIVIGFASDHLEDYMDRRIATGNYVTKLWGSGGWLQLLPVYPVVAVNYVTSYDAYHNPTSYSIDDFWVDNEAGILEWYNKNRYKFTRSSRWLFDYEAGFATTPGPVKHAAALQTVKMLQPLFRGGTNFTEIELITELDEQIVELLDPYKRRRIG
jgi:hypothetical protein